METKKSYIEMESEVKARMNNITPENLSLDQIIPTIKRMYLNGANDMDTKWRESFKTYCEEEGIEFKGAWFKLLNILNQ